MSSSHPPQYSSYSHSLPPPVDSVRLPSIKDLNFPPPGQDGAPANGNGRPEHPRSRNDTNHWSRSVAQSAPSHPTQHSSNMPPPHEPTSKSHQYLPPSKPDAPYAPSGPSPQQPHVGVPPHNSSGAAPPRPDNSADGPSKRSRSQSGLGASPARSPHTQYPPHPHPPPQGYGQPPPQEHIHQQPPHYAHQLPPPGYAQYPPPPMAQRHYNMGPPPAPPHHQPPPPTYAHPPPAEHWQQQHPPAQQPPPPQQFNGYTTTRTLVPANVEARPTAANPVDTERVNARQHVITEILRHCSVLYGFAHHYASLGNAHPPMQPSPGEIEEMNNQASTVVRLLEELRRLDSGEEVPRKESYPATPNVADEQARPPKRPWEDVDRDGEPASANNYEAPGHSPYPDEQVQSTAEQDMQIIRNKRQSSTGGAVPGQQKNKYRKRSRATPPGKCHSCNIRETPEWRRGPDGARTLCNACGLHYAKLMRKRDKTLDANGKAPPIDLQTLRASTASARGANGNSSDQSTEGSHPQPQPPSHTAQPPPAAYEQPKQPAVHAGPPPPHPGPYQLMSVGHAGAPGQPHPMMAHPGGPAAGAVPPPPWMSPPSSAPERGAYNAEPHSYVRASHPPSHARASPQ